MDRRAQAYAAGRFGDEGRQIAEILGLIDTPKADSITRVEYIPQNVDADAKLPEITSLCLTYGRFELLRRAVACFLLQDAPNKRMLIVNDAPVALNDQYLPENVRVINAKRRFQTVGDKRQFALEQAETTLVAHWDDDDVYFPWHLLYCSRALKSFEDLHGVGIVRPNGSWIVHVDEKGEHVPVPDFSNWEQAYAFNRQMALDYGGYPSKDVGQDHDMMLKFRDRGKFAMFNVEPFFTHLFDRGRRHGTHITEGSVNLEDSYEAFARNNRDFGDFQFIVEGYSDPIGWAKSHMSDFWVSFIDMMKSRLSKEDFVSMSSKFKVR